MPRTATTGRDPYYVYRPMLDLIGRSEGTDKGRGYNETLAYGAYTGGDRELVRMTLDQIDHLQTAMLAHPQNRLNSSALGRYQIVRTTLRKIRKALKLSGSELFDEQMQDRMACYLLGGRGIDRWLAGKMSEDALINALAKEWASLPTAAGKGHYSGQRASVTVADVRRALAEVKRRAAGESNSAPPPPPPETTGAGKVQPKPAPVGKGGAIVALFSALAAAAYAAWDHITAFFGGLF